MRRPNRRVLVIGSIASAAIAVIGIAAAVAMANRGSSSHQTGTISGVVTDSTGQPVAKINVWAYAAGTTQIAGQASTANDGSYTEGSLAVGKYDLYYSTAGTTGGWLSGWYTDAPTQAQAVQVRVAAKSTTQINIRLHKAGTITGKVTDPAGHPVAGIGVWAYVSGTNQIAWETSSGDDGSYREVNLGTGSYDLFIVASGNWNGGWYKGATSQAQATPVKIVAPNSVAGIDIMVHPKS